MAVVLSAPCAGAPTKVLESQKSPSFTGKPFVYEKALFLREKDFSVRKIK